MAPQTTLALGTAGFSPFSLVFILNEQPGGFVVLVSDDSNALIPFPLGKTYFATVSQSLFATDI